MTISRHEHKPDPSSPPNPNPDRAYCSCGRPIERGCVCDNGCPDSARWVEVPSPLTTYSRPLEIFGRTWTYDVRPVTLSSIPMHGVYEDGVLHAAFLIEEHACRYVDQRAGA